MLSLATLATLAAAINPMSPILRRSTTDFSCPKGMEYCAWTKSCSCPPGQVYNPKTEKCKGDKIAGCWPKPDINVFDIDGRLLAAFCAKSPERVVHYDENHKYCQAGLGTLTFVSLKGIVEEVTALNGEAIDLGNGDISDELKDVYAGLNGLYLKDPLNAVKLFNTKEFGLNTLIGDILEDIPSGIIGAVKGIACKIGIGDCNYDCVSYCTKGCKNNLNVAGSIGDLLEGLNGLCIIGDVIKIVDSVGGVVDHAVEGLLCIIGKVVKNLLSLFDCDCK